MLKKNNNKKLWTFVGRTLKTFDGYLPKDQEKRNKDKLLLTFLPQSGWCLKTFIGFNHFVTISLKIKYLLSLDKL